MSYFAVNHQGTIEMFWLHLRSCQTTFLNGNGVNQCLVSSCEITVSLFHFQESAIVTFFLNFYYFLTNIFASEQFSRKDQVTKTIGIHLFREGNIHA